VLSSEHPAGQEALPNQKETTVSKNSQTKINARAAVDQKRFTAALGKNPSTALRRLSARELFAILSSKREQSRPVIGQDRGPFKLDKTGRKRYLGKPTPIYGEPTFRNVIDESGAHV
jgi:hypothetical protein